MTAFSNFAVDVSAITRQRTVFDYGYVGGAACSAPMFGPSFHIANAGMNFASADLNLFDPGISSFGAEGFGFAAFAPTAQNIPVTQATQSIQSTQPTSFAQLTANPNFNQSAFAFNGTTANYNSSFVPFFPVFSTAAFDASFANGFSASSVDSSAKNNVYMDKSSLAKTTNAAPVLPADVKGLQPQMQTAIQELRKKAQAEGIEFKVTSGFRTTAQQQHLYNTSAAGYAARPGTSQHEKGTAVDLLISNQNSTGAKAAKRRLGELWTQMGYTWGGNWSSNREDWHFDLRPSNNFARAQYNPFL